MNPSTENTIDLSILTTTKKGMYFGRTIEMWIALGYGELLGKALGGEKESIKAISEAARKGTE